MKIILWMLGVLFPSTVFVTIYTKTGELLPLSIYTSIFLFFVYGTIYWLKD